MTPPVKSAIAVKPTVWVLLASLLWWSPAQAQSVIAEYSAYIGAADLTNSNGGRLSQPWQVIRQDRANVHRFGISQPGDDFDPIFGDFNARGQLEQLIRSGFISGTASDAILRGDVRLRVRVYGFGVTPSRVEVDVWNETPITAETAPSEVRPAAPPDPAPLPVPVQPVGNPVVTETEPTL